MSARPTKLRPVEAEGETTGAAPKPAEKIRLTGDRILVSVPDESERRSKAGLLIPATATQHMKRCVWSEVVLVGPETRNVRIGDRVLFIPHSAIEVDVRGDTFLLLRERDVQAIGSERTDPQAGHYL